VIPAAEAAPTEAERPLHIMHAGSIYQGKRFPDGLMTALADLRRRLPDVRLKVSFIGDGTGVDHEALARLGIAGMLFFSTPQYYLPSLEQMRGADVLLVIDADFADSPFLPSKVVDYLMFDKPIFGLSPVNSATSRVLNGIGYATVPPNDSRGIADHLERMSGAWRGGVLACTDAHRQARAAYDIAATGRHYDALLRIFTGKDQRTPP
jgi:glycosyltransferase involved in cell wall biosynthesis